MPDVWAVMRAVRGSDLSAPVRHVLLTLASLAAPDDAVIPEKYMPSLTELARFTGLGRSTVAEALLKAEKLGWLSRARPTISDARIKHVKTAYTLLIPASPAASPTGGLVQELDQLNHAETDTAGPGAGLGLVQELDQASPGAGHKETTTTTKRNSPSGSTRRGTRLPDDFTVTEEMKQWARENTPLVGIASTQAFIDHFRSVAGQKGVKVDWVAAWRNWMRRDQKEAEERLKRENRFWKSNGNHRQESNAPKQVPDDQRCDRHPGERAGKCGRCRSERIATNRATAEAAP